MKNILKSLTILLVFILLIGCSEVKKFEEGIYDKKEIFKEDVEEEFLLYYYATSCSYCQKFRLVLNKYAEKENALPVYAIDADDENTHEVYRYFIEEKGWDLRGTPTIYHIRSGEAVNKFEGVLELEEIPSKEGSS